MASPLTIALAQITLPVGDFQGNEAAMLRARGDAAAKGAALVAFPELSVSGYSPQDLILREDFLNGARGVVERLTRATEDGGPAMLIGTPWREEERTYNAALLLDGGSIRHIVRKRDLPNYGVFDEKRVFRPGDLPEVFMFRGRRLGAMICEDLWTPPAALALKGAELAIVINASPYAKGKAALREACAARAARDAGAPLCYLNLLGAQDDVVFDGTSFVTDAKGAVVRRFPEFEEAVETVTLPLAVSAPGSVLPEEARIWKAMTLGLRGYARRNGFRSIVLGLSGGIDSALSAAVAVEAVGAEQVIGVRLPSKHTSRESMEDAEETARLLGMRLETVSIEAMVESTEASLAPLAGNPLPKLTGENLQSRLRGVTLMALSNSFGAMVLTTGNKSELAVGYATLYGDMCGAYNVLKDVYKTEVYALARWRNAQGRVIPERSIAKAPTAELSPGQTDQDSLPPYEELDAILRGLIEEDVSAETLISRGFAREAVEKTARLLYTSEFKRRQSAPGVKIGTRALGLERRYPISSRYRQ